MTDPIEKTTAEKILEAGVASVSTEGTSTTFVSQSDLRKLVRDSPKGRAKRPLYRTINLGST